MQLGQASITSNNGWSGMLTQNLQPAPGNNPFFNLTAQQQQTATFTAQVCKFQQIYFKIFCLVCVWICICVHICVCLRMLNEYIKKVKNFYLYITS